MNTRILNDVKECIDNENFDTAKELLLKINKSHDVNEEYYQLAGYLAAMGMPFCLETLKNRSINFDTAKLKLAVPGMNQLPEELTNLFAGFLHGAIFKYEHANVPMCLPPMASA